MTFYKHYPNIQQCSIQVFDDTGRGGKKASIMEMNNDSYRKAKALNKEGYGVFFSVNSMNPGTRSKDNVTGVNAWICEVDELTKDQQRELLLTCPLMPSCIIESKKSYHMYRFCKDGTIENRVKINMGICELFGGDVKVAKDIARVLRLPGFNHMKDPDNPFLVECVHFEELYYTEQEMLEAFPYQEPEPVKREAKQYNYEGDDFRHFLNSLDNITMLQRISGTYLVDGETISFRKQSGKEQIYVNDEQTSCFIRDDGSIGSSDGGGPSWINWILWYGRYDCKEVYRWVKDNCRDIVPEKYYTITQPLEIDEKLDEFDEYVNQIEIAGSFNIEGAREAFGHLYRGDFVLVGGYQFSGKTSFVHHIGKTNAEQGKKVVFFSLEMSKQQILTRMAREKVGVSQTELAELKQNHPKFDAIKERYKEQSSLTNYKFIGIDKAEDREFKKLMITMESLADQGYDFFMIDSLGKIHMENKNELERFAVISDALRVFCTNRNVCVLLIHHMGKPSKTTGMKKPGGVGGLRGNHKVSDDATKIIEYWRDQESDDNKAEIIQYKDTIGGETGKIRTEYVKGEILGCKYSW